MTITNQRGFTLIELAAAIAFFVVLLGGVAAALATDSRTARTLVVNAAAETNARRAVERIASEIRMADMKGEDADEDGVMGATEDTNLNGVLDADWNLADGAVDATNISFNMSVDEWNTDGSLSASGILTSRVSYFVQAGRLIREQQPIDSTQPVLRSVILGNAAGLRISRAGSLVTISLDTTVPYDVSRYTTKTATATVRLLN